MESAKMAPMRRDPPDKIRAIRRDPRTPLEEPAVSLEAASALGKPSVPPHPCAPQTKASVATLFSTLNRIALLAIKNFR